MVRVRSLAKELRHLEKQKQSASTPSPPPAGVEDRAVDLNTTSTSVSPSDTNTRSSNASTTSREDDAVPHRCSPTAQAEKAASAPCSSSSSASPKEGGAARRESQHTANSNSSDSDERGAYASSTKDGGDDDGPRKHTKGTTSLFALGGSRFDILVNGSYGDGAACRKSEVRKAAKVCSNGKDALQRSQEDLTATGEEPASKVQNRVMGDNAGSGNDTPDEAAAAPSPPLGASCGIPARFPFKRLLAQPFSHILVCDFEATCASGSVHYPHEIIEFPVVVLDTATLRIVAEFHRYVKPVRNPKLTAFCTELTGITQEMVDQADTLPVVVGHFQRWLEQEVYPLCAVWANHYGPEKLSRHLQSEQKRFVYDDRTEVARANARYEAMICMATDGPWDMRRFMHECSVMRDGVAFPPLCYRYLNVRHSYGDHFKCRQVKLTHMLRRMSMSFEGRRHSGIDDTRNITRVLAELMARGYRVHHVSTIKYSHGGDAFLQSNKAAQELLSEYGEISKTHTSRHSHARKNAAKSGRGKR
ncbi:hypothetical protein ABB37_04611 [Leptomonas pyrrhocoris]|uniref:Exonuclease domain-containing protein n=1 Tax=Leptomonas pyrrhocoris TaxID=157538 RepID=A0A0N0DVH3_LEPPY|nr:hypothetical protein ABB37_04611 [Leptomonas pyrrhocoris]XP_015658782.1 hypothetical protein ABB37_04611 [Leptomonas pyrrhocoris]KPA80342.1 hypothetical protein ABB37_04611 [Leptomonas pyrrhocoris]KPA80343.1 hypothetical protein ABB37_04611 [Leptomonas pyrrhocoris]|eukprot:XP_015658781.1 hypothetical protein ABB37_04611 [Leptomonas pyrrhocoris]